MIVEQIRYFLSEENHDAVVTARRRVDLARNARGLPPGRILIADPVPEDGPAILWQCVYADDDEMAVASTSLIGNEDYEAARAQLAELIVRAELEVYTLDEPDEAV
jgi:hypothetical protein